MKLHLPVTLLVSMISCATGIAVSYGDTSADTTDYSTLTDEERLNLCTELENELVLINKDIDEANINLAELEARKEIIEDQIDTLNEVTPLSDDEQAQLEKLEKKLEEIDEEIKSRKEVNDEMQRRYDEVKAEIEKLYPQAEQEETTEEQSNQQPTETTTEETKATSAPEVIPQASTVNAMGTAQRDALRHHQWGLRDRLATLGQGRETRPATQKQYWVQPQKGGKGGHYVTSSESASDFRYSLWIEGIGDYSKLDQQGGRGGYTLKSWGGTVGAAATIDNNLTLGAAFSATWGDLSSSAFNERATGDLDSLYLDLFAHYQSNAWGHTLILTGTTTDASLNRAGVANGTPFSTHGDTDGYGLGALYELTYDIPLNDAGTSILQPLFDASIVSTSLDAYDETGIGALHVGKQEWTTGTVALGARWLGSFGTETVGQTFFGSLRLAVSQDIGDTRGETTISQGGISRTAYGSKVGSTALQIGAGISTNVTSGGTIYANVNADFRNRENAVYGSVGYRYEF